MNIHIDTSAVKPMLDWLNERRAGRAEESKLREILSLPAYEIEFKRYADSRLPVCTLSREEAVDFFLHFDEKDFDNPRLQMKKASFMDFYARAEEMPAHVQWFMSLGERDEALIARLLSAALPKRLLADDKDFGVVLTVSVGNSQGYPYENHLVFDAANLTVFPDARTVTMVLAHEIHHTFFGELIPEVMSPQAAFAVNFAFEGLAIHFCNNGKTLHKPAKYADLPTLGVCEEDFKLYDDDFDAMFADFRADLRRAATMTEDEVNAMIGEKYEQFRYVSRRDGAVHEISQYPTYYLGCFLWGSIDLALGKDALLDTLARPDTFIETYNRAARKLGNAALCL